MKKRFTLLLFAATMLTAINSYAQCDAPINLQSSYSNNVSTFSWDSVSTATEYYLEIEWAYDQWGSNGSITVYDHHFDLTGLMQGGNFQWRVTANCGGAISAPSATAFYTSPCVAPFNLSTTNITTNSAKLNWQQSIDNPVNTGFSVSYRLANTNNTWIQLTNTLNNPTATFFNLTGLAGGTAYEWRVRRICSALNSPYITSSFVTLSCISAGDNRFEWIDLFSLGSINRVSGAETGGYANVQTSTDLAIGSTANTGQISAGFSSNVRNQRFSVYIDFNRNGSFADAGERLISNVNINNAGIKTFSINIPTTVTAGSTRMRVVMRRNPGSITSCITGYFGESEDYQVNIVAPSLRTTNTTLFASEEVKLDVENSVFPNPSNGIFNISISKITNAVSYDVINMNGTEIQKNLITNPNILQLDITNMPAGLYLVRVINEIGIQTLYKLLKN